jgi:cysteine desulfuration protein SufE
MTIEDLLEEFEFLADWDEQCDFLIELGFDLPQLAEEAKSEENRVRGCQSNVWMIANVTDSDPPTVEFLANSDAIIVNGLIAVLIMLYSGKSPEAILTTDAEQVFQQLGLERHLSSQRRNGLYGMVRRIRQIATEVAAGQLRDGA